MTFIPALHADQAGQASDLWFVFRGEKLLVKTDHAGYSIPTASDLSVLNLTPAQTQHLGALDGCSCHAGEWPEGESVADGYTFKGLRELFRALDEEMVFLAGRANQLNRWYRIHRFCGQCGRPTRDKSDERAKICPECGLVNYPRVTPAVIVAVVKGNEILLGRSKRFPKGFHSVLAGFVEPGETLEACVKREVREEVGIEVADIQYFGSQPWPFPDSLMVAFTAAYAGGTIQLDPAEIVHADWYPSHGLPPVPPGISIARKLIDWFSENH